MHRYIGALVVDVIVEGFFDWLCPLISTLLHGIVFVIVGLPHCPVLLMAPRCVMALVDAIRGGVEAEQASGCWGYHTRRNRVPPPNALGIMQCWCVGTLLVYRYEGCCGSGS